MSIIVGCHGSFHAFTSWMSESADDSHPPEGLRCMCDTFKVEDGKAVRVSVVEPGYCFLCNRAVDDHPFEDCQG